VHVKRAWISRDMVGFMGVGRVVQARVPEELPHDARLFQDMEDGVTNPTKQHC
jgi:hypothetical protein